MADEKAERALRRAAAANALGRYEDGLREARLALQFDLSLKDGYGYCTQALLGLEEPAQALDTARAGLAHHPDSEWLNRNASAAAQALGLNNEALAFADEAVRLLPRSSLAHNRRARALHALRRCTEARAAYALAIELSPGTASHYTDLGFLLLNIAPAEAAALLKKSLELNPMCATTHNFLGIALLRLNRPEEAARAFRSAVQLDPTQKVARSNAHLTLSWIVGKPVPAWMLVAFCLGCFALATFPAMFGLDTSGLTVTILLIAIPWMLTVLVLKKMQARQAHRVLDPDLLRLYDQLEADLEAGRR